MWTQTEVTVRICSATNRQNTPSKQRKRSADSKAEKWSVKIADKKL